MIRITLIKPLPPESFADVSESCCIGAVMTDFAFQKKAGMQAEVWHRPFLLPGFIDRLLVNRVSKYDAIGLQGHESKVTGNVLFNNTFPVCYMLNA